MKSYMSVAGQERGDVVCWKSDTGSDQLWVIHDSYCQNPECPGCAAHICLIELNNIDRQFLFAVGLDEPKLVLEPDPSGEELSPEDHSIAEDFCQDASNRPLLHRRRQLVRAWGLAQAGGPVRAWNGRTYHLGDFDPHEKHYPIAFEANGVNWIVLDQYCVVPDCTCNVAHLSFYRVASGKVQKSPEVSAEIDLDNESVRESFPPPLSEGQLRVVADFKEQMIAWNRELNVRRKLLREIAAKRLSFPDDTDGKAVPAISTKRASRNDPCPCGSGRKYKKCCGKR